MSVAPLTANGSRFVVAGEVTGAMDFEIVGGIEGIETIASGTGIRERVRLRRIYGRGGGRRKGLPR